MMPESLPSCQGYQHLWINLTLRLRLFLDSNTRTQTLEINIFNLMSASEIRDRDALKSDIFSCEETSSNIPGSPRPCSTNTPITTPTTSHSSVTPGWTSVDPLSSPSLDRDTSDHSFDSADTPILDTESKTCSWPPIFLVPHFSYFAEIQLRRGNAEFRANGTPPPKAKNGYP